VKFTHFTEILYSLPLPSYTCRGQLGIWHCRCGIVLCSPCTGSTSSWSWSGWDGGSPFCTVPQGAQTHSHTAYQDKNGHRVKSVQQWSQLEGNKHNHNHWGGQQGGPTFLHCTTVILISRMFLSFSSKASFFSRWSKYCCSLSHSSYWCHVAST